METPKQLFDTRVNVSFRDTASPSSTAFAMTPPIRPPKTVPPERPPDIGADQRRWLSSPMAGLKPFADGIRNAPPFGLPKCEGQHERTRRSTGGVASSQVDPPPRRNRCPCPSTSALAGSFAASVYVPPPAALREVRLNGFPGALAEVPRHRIGGRRRVPEAVPTGSSSVANVREPAYPGYNPGAGEGLRPFEPEQPRAPVDCAGGGVAPLPPVTALRDG